MLRFYYKYKIIKFNINIKSYLNNIIYMYFKLKKIYIIILKIY